MEGALVAGGQISTHCDDALVGHQPMGYGQRDDELSGVTHIDEIQIIIRRAESFILVDVIFSHLSHPFQPTQLLVNIVVQLLDLRLDVLPYFLKPFTSPMITEIGDGAVSFDRLWAIANGVVSEPAAIVVLIEYPDPARYELQFIHLQDLVSLLLALAEGLVGGELIDIANDLFLFYGQQILEDIFDAFGVGQEIILLGIVEQAYEPSHMVVTDLLVFDVFGVAGHTQWVFYLQLQVSLGHGITVDLLIQLPRLDNRLVVTQVAVFLLLNLVLSSIFVQQTQTHT